MTIERAIKNFLKKLCEYQHIFDNDLDLSYDADILGTFIENVKNKLLERDSLNYILEVIDNVLLDDQLALDEDIDNHINIDHIEIVHIAKNKIFKSRARNFVSSSNLGAIIPFGYFKDKTKYELELFYEKDIEKYIRELILFNNEIEEIQLTKLFDKIINPQKNVILAIHKQTATIFEDLYSKNFFLYLLEGHKTIFPDNLIRRYKEKTSLISSINTSPESFLQFFEIYDVIDEYHHASDILIKYLKIYQMIEYLLTRTILVKIQNNSSSQNLFLRDMTSLSNYDDFDKKNFNQVFSADKIDLIDWFKKHLTVQKRKVSIEKLLYPNGDKTIDSGQNDQVYTALFKLIYQLRNTIVHNKVSEIHLTMHNIQQQPELIKFIKSLLKKLEDIVFKKLVNFDSKITYKSRNLELY